MYNSSRARNMSGICGAGEKSNLMSMKKNCDLGSSSMIERSTSNSPGTIHVARPLAMREYLKCFGCFS